MAGQYYTGASALSGSHVKSQAADINKKNKLFHLVLGDTDVRNKLFYSPAFQTP